MIFDNRQLKVPFESYVTVDGENIKADVYIEIPNDTEFSFENCVVIYFSSNGLTRRYFKYSYFKTFSDKDIEYIDLGGYDKFGIYLFFKDEEFLNAFKLSNKFII